MQINSEMVLDPDSRVMLGKTRDPFGQRQLVVDWRLGPQDYDTMRRAAEMMGRHWRGRESAVSGCATG